MTKYEKILLGACGFLVICLIWAGIVISKQEKIIYSLVTPSEYISDNYTVAPLDDIRPDTELIDR